MGFSNIELVAGARQLLHSQAKLDSLSFVLVCFTLLLYLLYYMLLPKPIPGIPYNKDSARRLLGDVPAMLSHIEATEGTFITYLLETVQSLNTPIAQLFYSPLKKPIVILADYREAIDLLRRKEFDRSSKAIELLKYLGPDHHIRQLTNARHKAQRRLIQDSMSPAFLNGVAAPMIHREALKLVELWHSKSRIADGRPWAANDDLDHAVLDAVNGFAYGPKFRHSALEASSSALTLLGASSIDELRRRASKPGQLMEFPSGNMDEVIAASIDVTKSIEQVQGSIWPSLRWEYVIRRPYMRKARQTKDAFVIKELKGAAKRMETGTETEKSAVDFMVRREKENASKEGRMPDYCSKVMIDEAFGFIIAGADTTSTSLCWAVKILADHPDEQTRLRDALQDGLAEAMSQRRNPTAQEITQTQIPYLDAWLDESLRTGGTIPMLDRESMVDTELLGHYIPKGTDVLCLQLGPGLMSPAFQIDEARRSTSSQAIKKEGREKTWDNDEIASFKPDRWLKSGEHGVSFDPNAGPHLAFSAGPRACFGKRLAYLEMRIFVTLLVWNFELLRCPKELSGYGSVMLMTSRPRHCYVRLREVDLGVSSDTSQVPKIA